MPPMIRVRNVPSPTGVLHIGTVRTALYNYLFAKKNGGILVYRSEDTDRKRSKKKYEENIISGLSKLGILGTEGVHAGGEFGPYHQSERISIYREYLKKLLELGHAYYCFCTKEELDKERKEQQKQKLPPRYSGKCRNISMEKAKKRIANGEKAVIRLKIPENQEIIFDDLIRGINKTNTKELADFIIAKNLDQALYNFTVTVDDYLMKITHVIRGEDHIPNTPKQILIYEAFDWKIPQFAHLPLILNQDKSKLSKRKNKVSVDDYLAEGYLPEALINFLALLGWNTADEKEIFSLKELTEAFSLKRVHKGGAVFDLEKLNWLNGYYLRNFELEELIENIFPYLEKAGLKTDKNKLKKYVPLIHERIKILSEAPDLLRFMLVDELDYEVDLFLHKKMKVDLKMAKTAMEKSLPELEKIPENEWNQATLEKVLIALVQRLELKNGQILWPLRVALTGEKFSPGVFEIAEVLGKEKSLYRIQKGVEKLQMLNYRI